MNRFNSLILFLLLALQLPLSAAVSANVRLNSVGFLPFNVKRASIATAAAGNFNIRRSADNSIAYTGTLSAAAVNADTAESLRQADFTALTEEGSFYLDCSVGQSAVFGIDADVYNDPFWATLMGFYSHRCGTAVNYTWKGQAYGHGACHLNDAYQDSIGGGHVIRDGTRGWHDAGDYGKYTINGSFATAMLLQAWEWNSAVLSQWQFPIPEAGGATPDYLDEIKWNLQWLRKMQAGSGAAYHKLTTYNFAGFVMPEADTADTQYAPAGSHATADLCGVMAMAARIYQPYDPAFAAQCQATADAAWSWLQANPGELLPNLAGFGTGAYNEAGTDGDHRAFAAAQYWETTGNAAALADFETRMAADTDLVSTFWDWGEFVYGKRGPKNHGIFSYLLSARAGRNAARVTALTNDLLAEANAIVATRNAHGYGRPLGAEYHWGSNGTVARQAMLLDAADKLSPNPDYVNAQLDALGHLFGRNTYNRSFLTGVGHNPPLDPHDRHSQSDGIVNPVPGHLVGGAEANASDWADDGGDFRTNEIAINWDAALAAALARFVTVPPPATPTPTPSPTPCFSATALRRVNVGGAQQTTGGNTWSADQVYTAGQWGYTGGAVSTNGNTIAGTTDDVLYNTGRYGLTQYQFTVPNGSYRVQVHFAETYFNAAGARVMSMTLEGQPAISNLDIYATVGGSTALVLTRDTTVSDGILTLGFSATADTAEIRALAVFASVACPSTPTFTPSPNWTATPTPTQTRSFSVTPTRTPSASITPTPSLSPTPCGNQLVARINAGGGAFSDSLGALWAADAGYTGGTGTTVANAIAGTADDTLYQSERYGSPLAYAFAVPQAGSYQVRFLWAETFHTGAGDRVFDVSLEGALSINDLDLFAAAGGADRAYQLTRTVTVNDGTLNISAVASVDQAKFNAIEVLWLGPACASPSPTGTGSVTGSPTRTVTASATRTPTPSPSRTSTPSPSPTASATRSSTASDTPSATPTRTSTAASTPTSSPTATASSTASASPTPSATASPSRTVTASPSPTSTRTPSPTGTPSRTLSPTASPSWTAVPLSSSPTSTPPPSATSTFSATSTATPTRTPTGTPSPSASPTATRTASPSATLTRSPSPSATLSWTPVPLSSSPTRSASPTTTFTGTLTAGSSPTSTLTASPSGTASRTLTPSPTATGTATGTRTATLSPSRTVTVTATPSASPPTLATPSATSTAIPTMAAPTAGGPPKITAAFVHPNPVRGARAQLRFHLEGPAEQIVVRCYTPARVLIREALGVQAWAAGWNNYTLELSGLPPGLNHLTLEAEHRGQAETPRRHLKLYRLP